MEHTVSSSDMNGVASTSPASSPTASGSTDTAPDELFIKHKVRKRDTLAGLAVKYNVAVADIKRANGFQCDTAMFGKDIILIPTKPLPFGPEYSAWAGMIIAHYGKTGAGPEGHLRATSAAALSELRGYYSTTPTSEPSPGADFSDDEDSLEYAGVFNPRGRRRASPGEVELHVMTRGGSTMDERLRRRRNADGEFVDEDLSPVRGASPFRMPPLFRSASERPNNRDGGINNSSTSTSNRIDAAMTTGINDLKEWHRKSLHWRAQLLNKLKRVASQPSMGMSNSNGMQQAAEAAYALAQGLGGGGGAASQKEGHKAD